MWNVSYNHTISQKKNYRRKMSVIKEGGAATAENKQKNKKDNIFRKVKNVFSTKDDSDFTAERAWLETTYGEGCNLSLEERIDRKRGSGCTSSSIPEWALYSLTAEILGKEDFTAEDFDASIDHILGGSYHELTFVMRDGSEITRQWKNRKGAEKCQEK